VSERFKEPVLKTGEVQASVGSNPTPSATCFVFIDKNMPVTLTSIIGTIKRITARFDTSGPVVAGVSSEDELDKGKAIEDRIDRHLLSIVRDSESAFQAAQYEHGNSGALIRRRLELISEVQIRGTDWAFAEIEGYSTHPEITRPHHKYYLEQALGRFHYNLRAYVYWRPHRRVEYAQLFGHAQRRRACSIVCHA
jgi:hypothetical protein